MGKWETIKAMWRAEPKRHKEAMLVETIILFAIASPFIYVWAPQSPQTFFACGKQCTNSTPFLEYMLFWAMAPFGMLYFATRLGHAGHNILWRDE